MDGVLIDSNPAHRLAWQAYNRRFGIDTGEEMQQRIFGRRNDEIVRDFFGSGLSEDEVAAHGAAKERLYREMIAPGVERALVPGIREFLARYSALPLGLATNAEAANVDFLLDAAALRPFFRAVVHGHQVRRPKPDPEIYLRTAGLLGVEPRHCVVFEDSYSGVAAARAAGMRTVGVTTTHRELPGVALHIRDFHDSELEIWLRRQASSC